MASKTHRPRRTRIYGANYDIGESLYKRQLDSLDNKRTFGRLNSREESAPPRVSFAPDIDDDERFKKGFSRKPFTYSTFLNGDGSNGDISDIPYSRNPKIFAADDFDLKENTGRDFLKRSLEISSQVKKSLANNFDDEELVVPVRARLIRRERFVSEDRQAATTSVASEASSRMLATKARLADLENEMSSVTERQTEREKRNLNLKKLLQESDAIDTSSALVLSKNIAF